MLFVMPDYPELERLFKTLLQNGVRPVQIERLVPAAVAQGELTHIFVDVSLPGALQWLAELTDQRDDIFPIALIQRGAREGSALAAGATGTLQLPLEPADVLLCVNRNRNRVERSRLSKELADRERRRIATASVESVLSTVCNELRNPLAAALANVEYLRDRDVGKRDMVHATDDALGIVDDTFEALQRVRGILESLTTLVKRELTEVRRVVFWEIAQRVIDDLGSVATPISLSGDPTVRGWADGELLQQVLSTLTRRALNASETGGVPEVKLRIYATDTEARISVRDNGPSLPADLMTSLLETPGAALQKGSSEMLLAITHHAVIRMGGVLDFAPRHTAGSVFRIRLRVARTTE